jgi:hypothetical protein
MREDVRRALNGDVRTKLAVIESLRNPINFDEVRIFLEEMTSDPHTGVRVAAIRKLAEIGDKDELFFLSLCEKDKDPMVAEAARDARQALNARLKNTR